MRPPTKLAFAVSPFISVRFLQAQTDSRLLSLAAEGHDRAFEALVRRYRRQLLAYSFRLLNSSSRAEDAVQQGLLQAWIALQRGTEVRDAKSWFYRIVHNTALNMQRGSAQDYAQLCDASTMDARGPDIEAQIEIADVFTELAALPPMQRHALLRTSLEGESHDEVATALGLSAKAVRGLVYRARASMRAAVGALIPTPLVNWALTAGKPGVGAADRIGELVAGGGGLATIAVNSGVAVVAVSALATGAAVAPHRHVHVSGHARAHVAGAMLVNGAGTEAASVSTANAGTTIRVSAGPSPSGAHLSRSSVAAQGATGTTSLGVGRGSGANAQRRSGSNGHGGAGSHSDSGGSGSSSGDGGHSSGSGSDSHAGSDHSGSGGGDQSGSSGGDKSGSSGSAPGGGASGSGSSGGSGGSGGSPGSAVSGGYGPSGSSDSHGGTGSDSQGSGSGGGGGDGTGSSPSTVTAPAPTTSSSSYGE
jgi:RNA polymerase sigma factor (sigma-70 family)